MILVAPLFCGMLAATCYQNKNKRPSSFTRLEWVRIVLYMFGIVGFFGAFLEWLVHLAIAWNGAGTSGTGGFFVGLLINFIANGFPILLCVLNLINIVFVPGDRSRIRAFLSRHFWWPLELLTGISLFCLGPVSGLALYF